MIPASLISADPFDEDLLIGKSLADLLQAGETVISREQDRINDPKLGDKGLDGAVVLQQAREIYRTTTGVDPAMLDPASRHGRLLSVQMDAIVEVMDANQASINAAGRGFKGFIPQHLRASSTRLCPQSKGRGRSEVTGAAGTHPQPASDVRERCHQIKLAPNWPRGRYSAAIGRAPGVRVGATILRAPASHAMRFARVVDVTGYPKEAQNWMS
jgi:hypothetical protein